MFADFDNGDHAHGGLFAGHGRRAILFLFLDGFPGGNGLLPGQLFLEGLLGHHIHAEGLYQLAKDVVGRHAVVFDVIQLRHDFLFHEIAHHLLDHLLLFGPLDHGAVLFVEVVSTVTSPAGEPH